MIGRVLVSLLINVQPWNEIQVVEGEIAESEACHIAHIKTSSFKHDRLLHDLKMKIVLFEKFNTSRGCNQVRCGHVEIVDYDSHASEQEALLIRIIIN